MGGLWGGLPIIGVRCNGNPQCGYIGHVSSRQSPCLGSAVLRHPPVLTPVATPCPKTSPCLGTCPTALSQSTILDFIHLLRPFVIRCAAFCPLCHATHATSASPRQAHQALVRG